MYWRGGGMSGRGPLPFSGGTAEQSALVMEVFKIMDAVDGALRAKKDG